MYRLDRYLSDVVALAVATISLLPTTAAAQQPLGTFRWQLEPHCNIVSVTVTPSGNVFRLEGADDQCGGGGDLASTIGTAFLNPDGTAGIGLNIVSTPGGAPVHVDAAISVATLNGTWRDSAGNTGNFTFRAGAGSGGTPRPVSGTIGAVSVNPTQVQLRIGGSCASGSFMQSVGQTGTVTCGSEVGDITSVSAGPGLVGGATSGAVALSLPLTPTAAFDLTNRFGFVSSATNTPTSTPPPLSGPGTRLLWHPGKAAFRVGQVDSTQWDQANIGFGSVAMGLQTIAKGDTAFAMGLRADASGIGSVALGSDVSASTNGTFMFGDRSTTTPMLTFVPNQFLVRAAGGTGIYSNAALTAGVELAPGSSSWSSV